MSPSRRRPGSRFQDPSTRNGTHRTYAAVVTDHESRDVRQVETPSGVTLVFDLTPAPADDRSGTGFLLVHGLASNARLWDGVARHLAESGFSSAAVDLRGHGRSGKPDDGYDYPTMCEDLTAVAEAFAATGPERIVAVGQSYGGNLVLELAARTPPWLAGVACVDGGVIDLAARFATVEEVERQLAPPATTGMPAEEMERLMRSMHPDWPEEGIAGSMANFEIRADGTVAPWLTLPRHLAILRSMWGRRPADVYPDIDVPVLLMPARGADPASAWETEKAAAVELAARSLGDVEVRWFSPADHDVHAQHPREVAGALVERFGPVAA
jgi:pimeloyl-ACP methyl ester carboxylesterase